MQPNVFVDNITHAYDIIVHYGYKREREKEGERERFVALSFKINYLLYYLSKAVSGSMSRLHVENSEPVSSTNTNPQNILHVIFYLQET